MKIRKIISHSSLSISTGDTRSVLKVLKSRMIAEGEYCSLLGKALKKEFRCRDIILTNTGSSSLLLALKLISQNEGSEVILPTYLCSDVIEVVYAAGMKPVLCDTGEYWNINVDNIKKHISGKTAAVIIPHNMGIIADVRPFMEFGIPVIEDCCQCFAPSKDDGFPGSVGDLSVLSFNATKCLTGGEGGALVINNEKYLEKADLIRSFQHIIRMSDIQASLCYNQLSRYTKMIEKRRRLTETYFQYSDEELTSHFYQVRNKSIFFRFLLFSSTLNYSEFSSWMYKNGVIVRKGIDDLLHRKYNLGNDSDFRNAVKCFNNTISVPIYTSLSEQKVIGISGLINRYHYGDWAAKEGRI